MILISPLYNRATTHKSWLVIYSKVDIFCFEQLYVGMDLITGKVDTLVIRCEYFLCWTVYSLSEESASIWRFVTWFHLFPSILILIFCTD